MTSSPAPKLPLWAFFVTDAVLIAIAGMIAYQRPRPWSEAAILAIVACVLAGAAILFIPLVARYERQKNETLDDRQRALEALARTVASSAEQISIATSGLNEIGDIAQRTLKHAEQLPHKLQDKVAEFQTQLANASDVEKEELERELEELRASETERLQSTSDKIAKAATDLAKLEASIHQHLGSATAALEKLPMGTANAIGKAQAAAEQAMVHARQEAAKSVADAAAAAVKSIDTARVAAIADLSAQFDANVSRIQNVLRELGSVVEQLKATASVPMPATAIAPAPAAPVSAAPEPAPATEIPPAATAAESVPAAQAAEVPTAAPAAEGPAPTPKRTRKPRREEAPARTAAEAPASTPEEVPTSSNPAPAAAMSEEPAPVRADTIPEVAPVAPHTASPFNIPAAADPTAESPQPETTETVPAATPQVTAPEPPKPARKRTVKKMDDDQPGLRLDLDLPENGDGEGRPAVVERVLSSDGATRLIVTAYIGIGNRLFIRGQGPGLSWEKGQPLQFVSIGKWRWETNDASGPVQVKLLKNDEQESSAVGTLTIEPGHQHEVTATF